MPLRSFTHEFQFHQIPMMDISVQTDLEHLSPGVVGSSVDPLSLEQFIGQLPYKAVRNRNTDAANREGFHVPPVHIRETPEQEWLRQFRKRKQDEKDRTTDEKKVAPRQREPRRQLDEDELLEVHEVVETIRRKFKDKYSVELAMIKHFTVEHRGGRWTMVHCDMPVNSCRGVRATSTGDDFLLYWGLNREFGCSFEKYGFSNAEIICVSWCDRMAHFFAPVVGPRLW